MNKKPHFSVYTPIKISEGNTFWHKIGSAWNNEKTISIKLNSLPLNGDINLFEYSDEIDKTVV